jgi:hypothetical protein
MTVERYLKQSNASPERQKTRLEAKIPEDRTGCWLWSGSLTKAGYGLMRTGPGKRDYVHRLAYRLFVGEIPDGLQLDHLCRHRACFNPRHLEPVTSRDNFLRGNSPGAVAHRTGMCRNGHPLTPDNVLVRAATGARRCRTCHIKWQRQRRAAAKTR